MAAGSKQLARKAPIGMAQTVAGWPDRLRNYVGEIEREMRLVTWPNREKVRATTLVVLATVAAFAVFFGVVDFFLRIGQHELYQYFSQ